MKTLTLVVAMDLQRAIGRDNQLPWHLRDDLKHFKSVTMGKPILMGRKTYDSIGRPLPGRQNIVLSRNSQLRLQGIDVVNSISDALRSAAGDEVMVIGGALFMARRDSLTGGKKSKTPPVRRGFSSDFSRP